MAELFKVNAPVRKPLFEGVQGENEARSIQFDITPWVEELGDGAVTATAKRSQDSQPYPVTVTKDGNIVTWKPTSTDTAYAGVGSFQLEYTVDSVLAKTCIWSTMVAPSLDPAGDPPDPYDNWLAEMRQIAADALQDAQDADASAQDAEAWAKGTKNGTPVPSTADQYENNAKYYAEQSLANQYGAYIVKSASGDIASFSDGADNVPVSELIVNITATQAGSGTPSPSNPRPISGHSSCTITVEDDIDNPQEVNTVTISLGDTYYGGTLNVTTGVLNITWLTDIYNSNSGFSNHAPSDRWYKNGAPTGLDIVRRGLSFSNILICEDRSNTYGAYFYYGSSGIYINKLNADETLEDLNTRLSSTPLFIVYPLAEPIQIQLTPTEVRTLLEDNNIFADTGDVNKLVYFKTGCEAIARLIEAYT